MTPLDIAIDVSDNNPKLDWPAIYGAGIRVAFCKIIEYPGHAYPTGPTQLAGARKAGLIAIPYGFLRPVNPLTYIAEFKARCDLAPGMPFMLDWEGRANQTCAPMTAEKIGEELALIAKRPPIGYWGRPGSTPAAPTATMRAWERMIPRYPVVGTNRWDTLPPGPRHNPELWWNDGEKKLPRFAQYTAWGRVPGVTGVVDRSVIFADNEEAALDWCRGPSGGAPVYPPTAAGRGRRFRDTGAALPPE